MLPLIHLDCEIYAQNSNIIVDLVSDRSSLSIPLIVLFRQTLPFHQGNFSFCVTNIDTEERTKVQINSNILCEKLNNYFFMFVLLTVFHKHLKWCNNCLWYKFRLTTNNKIGLKISLKQDKIYINRIIVKQSKNG